MKMNKIYILAFAAVILPATLAAQMQKQVEVTRDYVPSIERAQKLAVEPDMTDTTRMRPDIDYSITPLSWQTSLTTDKFRPATVTYWDFNRPSPFYIKAGVGIPLQSEGDIYVSTQNPDTGFAQFRVNHRGTYDNVKNYFGEKHDSRSMDNLAGITLGLYTGRRQLAGDFSYEDRNRRRNSASSTPESDAYVPAVAAALGDRINTGRLCGEIRFGDDFADLSRTNFNVAVRGIFFRDDSKKRDAALEEFKARYGEYAYGASASVARRLGRNTLRADADYDAVRGTGDLDYGSSRVHAALRYGREAGFVEYLLGADYWYDAVRGTDARHRVAPYLRLRFNISRKGHIVPFVEADGELSDNDFMSLSRENPYVVPGTVLDAGTMRYNFRAGIAGNLAASRLSYRLFVSASFADDDRYWYVRDYMWFGVMKGRRNIFSLEGDITYRPVSGLELSAMARASRFGGNKTGLCNTLPSFEGRASAQYTGRRWKLGASADLASRTEWTNLVGDDRYNARIFKAPFTVDLRAVFEWSFGEEVSIFVEGRNLLNNRIYGLAYCPGYGIGGLAGVKLQF